MIHTGIFPRRFVCVVRRWPGAALLAALWLLPATGCQQWTAHNENVGGLAMYQQGNYHGALTSFQRAVAANPVNADGYYNVAATHHRLAKTTDPERNLTQAEGFYNLCLERDPNHLECYRGLAVCLVEKGDPNSAFTLLNNWAANSPASAEPMVELARLYLEFNEPDEARNRLQQAIEIEPDNPRAIAALAQLHEASGNHAQALANYERSLRLSPHQPGVAERIASLRGITGTLAPGEAAGETRLVEAPNRLHRY